MQNIKFYTWTDTGILGGGGLRGKTRKINSPRTGNSRPGGEGGGGGGQFFHLE